MILLILTAIFSAWSFGYNNNEYTKNLQTIEEQTLEIIKEAKTPEEKIELIYLYVRDQIDFNWKYPPNITAEEVLNNGYGVCMQKAHLLNEMLKTAGFETRFKFMFVKKQALEDFLPGFAYKNWMNPFPHTVTQVKYNNNWVSFDPSINTKLYNKCLEEKLNFAKYPNIVSNYNSEFTITGMKGTQEFWEDKLLTPFYGNTLEPLTQWEKNNVPWYKNLLKRSIYRKAKKIMDNILSNKDKYE